MGSSVTRLAISDIVSREEVFISGAKRDLDTAIAAFIETYAELTDLKKSSAG